MDLTTLVSDNNPTAGTYTFYTALSDAENDINAVSNPVSPLDTTLYYVKKETHLSPLVMRSTMTSQYITKVS